MERVRQVSALQVLRTSGYPLAGCTEVREALEEDSGVFRLELESV